MRPRSLGARVLSVVLRVGITIFAQVAPAQILQFWPETDAHISLTNTTRLWLQADRSP